MHGAEWMDSIKQLRFEAICNDVRTARCVVNRIDGKVMVFGVGLVTCRMVSPVTPRSGVK